MNSLRYTGSDSNRGCQPVERKYVGRFSLMQLTVHSLLAVLVFSGALTGCSGPVPKSGDQADGRIKVVASIFAPYDFARQIAGDAAEVKMLVPPGSESHSFEPTPKDIIDLQECDVFIYVGGESDAWIDDILTSFDTSDMHIIRLMDVVDTTTEQILPGMEAEAGEESGSSETDAETEASDQPEQDEHIWTSIANAKEITQSIATALQAADPVNASLYESNATNYLSQLDELDAQYAAHVGSAQRKTLVFGDRFPFRYLADEYGLECFAAFPGCSTQTEASAQTIAFLIDKVRSEQIPAVLYIELSSHRIADAIAEQTGAEVLLLHACHNISKADFEAGATYLSLMQQNLKSLEIALN